MYVGKVKGAESYIYGNIIVMKTPIYLLVRSHLPHHTYTWTHACMQTLNI